MKLLKNIPCDVSLFSSKANVEEIRAMINGLKSAFTLEYGLIWELISKKSHIKERLCNVDVLSTENILLPGTHNVENYMAAISLTRGLVSNETIKHVASTFKGVEHRLEFVRELGGVKYYNSSIDSSPSRTAAALSAIPYKPIVICGGYDKNIPFDPLAKSLDERAKAVILTGATADKILSSINSIKSDITIYVERDFECAVNKARDIAQKDDIVLLSPACASFDAFKNFMERGNRFKQIVNEFK
jgi:UDP-N-acetylmuramoylalanine--D-glutamate ligase